MGRVEEYTERRLGPPHASLIKTSAKTNKLEEMDQIYVVFPAHPMLQLDSRASAAPATSSLPQSRVYRCSESAFHLELTFQVLTTFVWRKISQLTLVALNG